MICDKCGFYMDDEALTCEKCGAMLKRKPQKDEGVAGLRQGKPSSRPVVLQGRETMDDQAEMKIYADPSEDTAPFDPKEKEGSLARRRRSEGRAQRYGADAGRPQSKRGIAPTPTHQRTMGQGARKNQPYLKKVQKRSVNWMKLGLLAVVLVILLILGGMVYLQRVPAGQRLSVRLGREAPAQAYWMVGDIYMNEGKVNQAIETYLKADAKQRETSEKKDQDNVNGMLSLAAAYEAAGQQEESEKIYRYLIESVEGAKNIAAPYQNLIRILLSTQRAPEGAQVMQVAHTNTGDESFLKQRSQTLPAMPEIAEIDGKTMVTGRYSEYISIPLVSPQGYEVYYVIETGRLAKTLNPADVQEKERKLYTEPIALNSNQVFTIRAVCQNGELISDPLVLNYTISLPLPEAPNVNLAPNTYEQKQRVRLSHEDFKNVTIYYTIDGSQPDENSPRYQEGDAIELPSGKVTLRAIAVDGKGVISNAKEVGYYIKAGKIKKQYNLEDTFTGFTIGVTLRDEFEKLVGAPKETIEDEAAGKIELKYPWGYAIAQTVSGKRVITQIYMTENVLSAPRNTKIGMSIDEVVEQFRDLGQVPNEKGDRGIYSDTSGVARIIQQEGNQELLEYIAITLAGDYWYLRYHVQNGKVTAISHSLETGVQAIR